MKTLFIYLLNLAFIAMMLPGAVPAMAKEHSDFYTISGVVKDKNSQQSLEYANISVPGTNIGTVTNKDGEFTLKIPRALPVNAIEISYIGYFNYRQSVEGKDVPKMTFNLTPNTVLLPESIVNAERAEQIVAAAVNQIAYNYADKASLLTCFYRETAQKDRRYINISEAVAHVYKTPYSKNIDQDQTEIFKGRQLLSPKVNDTLAIKLLGGANLSLYGDVVKNPDLLLDKNTLSYFIYRMELPTSIDNRPHYVISFSPGAKQPYPLYYGTLYIDKENLSFTRAEFSLDMSDRAKAIQSILHKKPIGLRFKPTHLSFLVTYKQRDGKTYLDYVRNEVKFKCDWKRRLFSTDYTVVSEMVVTESTDQHVNAFPGKAVFRNNQVLSDKALDFFDEDFWGEYNIIEPTESLQSAVKKLKKQYK